MDFEITRYKPLRLLFLGISHETQPVAIDGPKKWITAACQLIHIEILQNVGVEFTNRPDYCLKPHREQF